MCTQQGRNLHIVVMTTKHQDRSKTILSSADPSSLNLRRQYDNLPIQSDPSESVLNRQAMRMSYQFQKQMVCSYPRLMRTNRRAGDHNPIPSIDAQEIDVATTLAHPPPAESKLGRSAETV